MKNSNENKKEFTILDWFLMVGSLIVALVMLSPFYFFFTLHGMPATDLIYSAILVAAGIWEFCKKLKKYKEIRNSAGVLKKELSYLKEGTRGKLRDRFVRIGISRNFLFIGITILAVAGIDFYWFAVRPSSIRKECSWVIIETYSAQEKQAAKDYVNKNCSSNKNGQFESADCYIQEQIISAPLNGETKRRRATDEEYINCLRENGMDVAQLQSDLKLKNMQQAVTDQQAQLDSQQQAQQAADQRAKIDGMLQSRVQQAQDQQLNDLQQQVTDQQDQISSQQNQINNQQETQQEYQNCLDIYKSPDGYIDPGGEANCKMLYSQ